MSDRVQMFKVSSYLRGRHGDKTELTEDEIAQELLASKATVSVLLGSGELKSCHVDDVAEYILEKDN